MPLKLVVKTTDDPNIRGVNVYVDGIFQGRLYVIKTWINRISIKGEVGVGFNNELEITELGRVVKA